MPFSKDRSDLSHSGLHLTREGGHSKRRVAHATDATGLAMQNTLQAHVLEKRNVTIFSHSVAIDLILRNGRCVGLYAYNRETQQVEVFAARKVVLASGGAAKVYLYTSNPDGSTGDGIAMAWRAGCRVANMEFIQFHPTCLYHPEAKSFLITEALRGEGAKLLLPDGTRFMPRFDERAELAPRDIVARAIDHEMKRMGADCVYLDISHKSRAFIKSHFPTIYKRCKEFDIDITSEPIYRTSTPSVKSPTRACTEQTAWPVIPCWNAWFLLGLAPAISAPPFIRRPHPPDCPSGMNHRSPTPTKKSWCRTTGTSCAVSCGTTWA
jgi:L-aspartate oxidase